MATHFLLLLVSESNKEAGARSRVGITVTTKVGNAVTRNRLKRWTREYVRLHPAELPVGELVIVAKASAAEVTHAQVDEDLATLFRRARGTAAR